MMPLVDPRLLEALDASRGQKSTPANIDRLAKQFGPELAREAFAQWALRERAKAKFSKADEMLFDRDGLEMATNEQVAAFHASLFPPGVHVVDMTCGIGADLIAFARHGLVTGFDIDHTRLAYCRHNLDVYDEDACLIEGSSEGPLEYGFADPARRSEGKRVSRDGDAYEPPLPDLAAVLSKSRGGMLKLSPLLSDRTLTELGGQVAFVSFGRECREVLVLFGECRRGDGVWAVHIEGGEWIEGEDAPVFGEDRVGDYFYEADPAAIRAHALTELCQRFELVPIGDSGGYLTGGNEVRSPWLRGYRVLWSGKADNAQTRKKLDELGSSTPVIKQRAAGLDLDKLRKQMRTSGAKPLVLAVWPVGKSLRHAILEPLPQ